MKSLKTGRKSTKTDAVHSIRLFRYPYFQQQFWVPFLLLLNHENSHSPLQHQNHGEKRQVMDLEIEIVLVLESWKNFNWMTWLNCKGFKKVVDGQCQIPAKVVNIWFFVFPEKENSTDWETSTEKRQVMDLEIEMY